MPTQDLWNETELRAARLLAEQRPADAEDLLTRFLGMNPVPSMRRDALMLRSSALEIQGKRRESREDLVRVLELCGEGEYARYVAELALGGLYAADGDKDAAMSWYRRALTTALHGQRISAGAALLGILKHAGPDAITGELADLWWAASRRSWAVLNLDGEPPDDPRVCVDAILRGQERAPTPR